MKKLIDIKRFTFYLWVGLGFVVFGFLGDMAQNQGRLQEKFLDNGWRVLYVIVVHYYFFEFTWPTLGWKRFFQSVLRIIGYVFLYSWGMYLWSCIGIAINVYTTITITKTVSQAVSIQMSYSMMSVFFFGIIRHIHNYRKLKQTAQMLHIEKQQAELNYLKSQTNPHFLFNTLNNIYSLSRDKSDLAPESILRLSKILRFMLYETGGQYIAIEQELKIMSDYIALEKLRYDESLRINFNYDVEDMKQALPPLLLIPLVENAFKHGVSETRNQPFVDIHLSVNKRQLAFVVKNSTEEFNGDGRVKENIGLSNLRRQLELLYKDYNMVVQQSLHEFTATLQINLASHV